MKIALNGNHLPASLINMRKVPVSSATPLAMKVFFHPFGGFITVALKKLQKIEKNINKTKKILGQILP